MERNEFKIMLKLFGPGRERLDTTKGPFPLFFLKPLNHYHCLVVSWMKVV